MSGLAAILPAATGAPAVAGRVRVATVLRAALWVLLAGNLVRLPALTSGAREAPVSLNDLAVAGALAAGLLACAAARSLAVDGVARAALAFAAVGGVSAVLAAPRFGLTAPEVAFSLAYLARWLAYFGLYVIVVNCVARADIPAVARTLEAVVLVFAGFGIVQSLFLPGFAQLVYPESTVYVDWDPQGRRLVSTFLDPNFAGAFVCVGFVLGLARASVGERGLGGRLALLGTALLLTASRSTILAALVGGAAVVAATGLARRVARLAVGAAVALAIASVYLVGLAREYNKLTIDASALARLVSWVRALRLFADNPVIGIGFNTYGFAQRAYGYEPGRGASSFSLDGGLLFVAVLTGVVGLAFYLLMIKRMASRARRVWRDASAAPRERAVAIGAVAATAAMVVHSLFVNSLFVPFLLEPLWVLWGLVYAASRPTDGGGEATWHRAPVRVADR